MDPLCKTCRHFPLNITSQTKQNSRLQLHFSERLSMQCLSFPCKSLQTAKQISMAYIFTLTLSLSFILFILCVCFVWEGTCHDVCMMLSEQFCKFCFLLPSLCGFWRLNSGHQAYLASSFTWWAIYLAHTDLRFFLHSEVYSLRVLCEWVLVLLHELFLQRCEQAYTHSIWTDDRLMEQSCWSSAWWIKEFHWLTHSVGEELLTEVQVFSTVAWLFHKLVIII